jgi:hypothetical protein
VFHTREDAPGPTSSFSHRQPQIEHEHEYDGLLSPPFSGCMTTGTGAIGYR